MELVESEASFLVQTMDLILAPHINHLHHITKDLIPIGTDNRYFSEVSFICHLEQTNRKNNQKRQ
jgi:hypothetical protein